MSGSPQHVTELLARLASAGVPPGRLRRVARAVLSVSRGSAQPAALKTLSGGSRRLAEQTLYGLQRRRVSYADGLDL